MTEPQKLPEHPGDSTYEICIQGSLDARWRDWFDGFEIFNQENGQAVMVGAGIDQAALHGILIRIRDLGLPLISVRKLS